MVNKPEPKPTIDTKPPVPKPREVPCGEITVSDFSDGGIASKPLAEPIKK